MTRADPSWIDDSKHVFVSGATGGGKSTLVASVFQRVNRVAFVWNPHGEEMFGGATVHLTSENEDVASAMVTALQSGSRKIDIRPHWDEAIAQEQLMDFAIWLQHSLTPRTPNTEYLIVVDECHQFARSGDTSNALVKLTKESRKWGGGCKIISVTQEPQLVSHSVLRQSAHTIWAGPTDAWGEAYYSSYGIDHTKFDEGVAKLGQYCCTLMDVNNEFAGWFVLDSSDLPN